jgi:membrane associated rhomboid family serine protease
MFGNRFTILGGTPPVVKNLIYLNIIMFLATIVLKSKFQIDLNELLGAHYYQSQFFHKYQVVTYLFMHENIMHIFFNMFGLWMFGKVLETVWGSQRFFIYYFVTGIGAILVNMLVQHFEFRHIAELVQNYNQHPSFELFDNIVNKYVSTPSDYLKGFISRFQFNPTDIGNIDESRFITQKLLQEIYDVPTIGASGAIFGVLLAFGMLFPNTELMLLFPPIPIKAKYFVIGYGAIELYSGLSQPGSDIAHFAHLGGMLFGFILIKYWNSKRTNFY